MKQTKTKAVKGAASIYTVLYFSLIITVIAVSFISIMLRNRQSSTTFSLYDSAYDAALAGVEDAKILLIKYNACVASSSAYTDCNEVVSRVNAANSSENCNLVGVATGRIPEDATEVPVDPVNDASDNSTDLAYTCVKVSLDAEDYIGRLSSDSDYRFIPLRAVKDEHGNTITVKKVRISWFTDEDVTDYIANHPGASFDGDGLASNSAMNGTGYGSSSSNSFTNGASDDISKAIIPTLSIGLYQVPKTFTVDQLRRDADCSGSGCKVDHGLMTLRPSSNGSATNTIADSQTSGFSGSTLNATNAPYDIACHGVDDFSSAAYACVATINLPNPIPNGADTKVADDGRYLSITTPYTRTTDPEVTFKIEMLDDSGAVVRYAGVQNIVDSTGRASDVFRRVQSRVELVDTKFPYAKFALSVYGDQDGEGYINKDIYYSGNNCWYSPAAGGSGYATCSPVESVNSTY